MMSKKKAFKLKRRSRRMKMKFSKKAPRLSKPRLENRQKRRWKK